MASRRLTWVMLAAAALAAAAPANAQLSPPRVLPTPAFNTTPSRTLRLEELAGCVGPNAGGALQAGLDASCRLEGMLAPKELIAVTFTVAPPANTTAPTEDGFSADDFELLVQLRGVRGRARLGLRTPEGTGGRTLPGQEFYATSTTSEEFVALSAYYLRRYPGQYTVYIMNPSNDKRSVMFGLQVRTPLVSTMLVPEEVEVIRDLADRCCPAGNLSRLANEFCNVAIPAAVAPNHKAADDFCHLPPLACDNEGRLQQLSLPGAGLDCGGKGLPPSFSKLSQVQVLDLAFNNIGGTTDDLAAILEKMPALRRAFLRYTEVEGTLPCALVDNPSLVLLSVSGNPKITGSVPACYLNDATLEEVFASSTSLSGELPDVIPEGSPLRTIFLVGSADPGKPRLSGALPNTMLNAGNLSAIDLSNHEFEGPIPQLPAAVVLMNVSGNQLTALPAHLPDGIISFDASYNQLKGSIPPISRNLEVFAVEANQLTGPLPGFAPARRRRSAALRLARRLLQTGLVSPRVEPELDAAEVAAPALDMFFAARNQLTGTIPAEWGSVPRRLGGFDVSYNNLTGVLPDAWDLPKLILLDASSNQLEGTLPPALGALPELVFLDVRKNQLSGTLEDFANTVAAKSTRLLRINLNGNKFTGPVPPAFARAPIFLNSTDPVMARMPLRRVLNLANNSLSGPFPLWALSAIPKQMDVCRCVISFNIDGPDTAYSCPSAAAGKPYLPLLKDNDTMSLFKLYQFNCTAADGSRVPLLSALDGSKAAPDAAQAEAAADAAAAAAAAKPVALPTPSKASSGPNAGAVAGGVVGALAAIGLAAGGAFALRRRSRLQRQGWAKEELAAPAPAGISSLDHALGISRPAQNI